MSIQNVGKDQKSIDNIGVGTAGTGNVVIAPNILEEMASNPEKAAYYEGKIDVQLITDRAILDLIRNKYFYLGLYYFDNHSIQQEWFVTHTRYMLAELGERYNRDFNVETAFSDNLSLFIPAKAK